MDKSISVNAKDMTIEELVEKISNDNVWINRLTLVSPGFILLLDLLLKNNGIENTSIIYRS